MSRTSNPPLSVAQLLEIVPSEDSWVNDGFTAVVRAIKPPPANDAKKFWKCTLADTTGSATISMTVFFAPKFSEGDQIDVVGQGIKRKEYNGTAEVSVGQKSEIHIVGRAVRNQEPGTASPAAAGAEAQPKGDFHKVMKRQALLYLHCLDYARQVDAKNKAVTGTHLVPDLFQACVSSLFIEANRQGISGMVPAFGAQPQSAQPAQTPPPRSAPPPAENLDEDVPF